MKDLSLSDLTLLLVLVVILITAGQINLANSQEPVAIISPETKEKTIANDFSWIRGANYVPSYARNDVQIWMDYNPEVIDRELSYAKKMKLNSIRIFLQYAVYEHNPKQFLARYENFLSLCEKHDIQAMIVVFDSCFGEYPDLLNYRTRDWMANPGQNMLGPEYWPELEKYIRDVCGKYRGDKRIVMWDVMNEPFCTSRVKEKGGREKIWTFLNHFLDVVGKEDPTHPCTVGYMSSRTLLRLIDKIDVLGFHNYTGDMKALQADIRYVKALGAKHSKPVHINEIARRNTGQDFWKFMPVLREEGIGWYFWELMLGSTQFSRGNSPIQGVVFPDGTCRNPREIAAIMNIGAEQVKRLFPQIRLQKVTDKDVTYTGFWTRWTGKGPRNGYLYYTNTSGDKAELTFTDSRIYLIHKIGPDCGIAKILIDSNSAATIEIDTYSATVDWNRQTLLAQKLPNGKHTVTIEATGKKHEASTNTYIQIVGFETKESPVPKTK